MLFGRDIEGILEILDERLGAFHFEMVAMMGSHSLGDEVVDSMTWEDFVMRFGAEFAPMIEVK